MLSGRRKETPPLQSSVGPSGGEEGEREGEGEQPVSNGRRRQRSGLGRLSNGTGSHIEGYNEVDEMDEESDAASSGNEWNGGNEDNDYGDVDEEMSDVESSPGDGYGAGQQSLVVQLRYGKAKQGLGSSSPAAPDTHPTASKAPSVQPIQSEASEESRQQPFAVIVPVQNETTAPPPVKSDKQIPSPESTAPTATVSLTSLKDARQVTNIERQVKEPQVTPMDTDIPPKQENAHPVSGQNGLLPGHL